MSSLASPIEAYAMQQRQRMAAIRAATERERELLNERLVAAADPPRQALSSSSTFSPARVGSAPFGLNQSSISGVVPTMQSAVPSASSSSSPLPHHTPWNAEKAIVMKEREELRARAEILGEQMAKIRKQEHEIAAEEADVDRRLQRAADRKRDLLSQLKAVQIREEDLKAREAMADAKEKAVRQSQEEVRVRQRDSFGQLATVKAEVSQREVLFAAAAKRHNDKLSDQQRAVQRLRQQLADAETRVRALEMQANVKARAVDDLERETMRAEMTLRDEEMHIIEGLRREIDNRKASLVTSSATLANGALSTSSSAASPLPLHSSSVI